MKDIFRFCISVAIAIFSVIWIVYGAVIIHNSFLEGKQVALWEVIVLSLAFGWLGYLAISEFIWAIKNISFQRDRYENRVAKYLVEARHYTKFKAFRLIAANKGIISMCIEDNLSHKLCGRILDGGFNVEKE